ncbi:UDP-N-acetylmuramoyl-L-alanine--D-glutamate ligase [Patescibacteria group bacterium]|nr:UDP-N-acetylmuramoyl-L-alanine--D-glutamate ligase [Patescibacteria group bacterium]
MDLSRLENFKDAIVTVMGLGRYKQGSGLGSAKWLMRHGAQTVITDLKSEQDLKESVDLVMEWFNKYRELYPDRTIYQPVFVLGTHREEDFTGVDCVMQNPGVPSESEFIQAAKKLSVPIESDVSIFFRYFKHPVVAVTGTKGKTTTTLIIGEMLKKMSEEAITAGNVRVSPLEFLDELLKSDAKTPVVLELSSWLLESLPGAFADMKRGPDIAVLTNISPDHLDRYPSYEAYIASKEIIFQYQNASQITILNKDHDIVSALAPKVKAKLYWYSMQPMAENGCYIKDGKVMFRDGTREEEVIAVTDIALQGDHNISNALAAVAASLLRGVAAPDVAAVLKSFKGVDDRQELVREVDEIMYINDTAATAPDAVVAALKHFGKDGRVVLIAGGVDKKMEYKVLADEIAKSTKALVLFPGTASEAIERELAGRKEVHKANSMKEAVQTARKLAQSGDFVVLSPGAASFNMFKNEFDRGEQFREEVRNL